MKKWIFFSNDWEVNQLSITLGPPTYTSDQSAEHDLEHTGVCFSSSEAFEKAWFQILGIPKNWQERPCQTPGSQ